MRELAGFSSEINVSLYPSTQNWSSTGMLWNDKIEYDKKISSASVEQGGLIELDITDFAKDCVRDENGTRESAGFVM